MRIAGIILTCMLFISCSEDVPPIENTHKKIREKTLTIAILPEQNVFEQKKRYKPLAEYLSDKLEINVKIKLLDSYGAIYEEFIARKIDGAFFGSFNYALTKARTNIIPLARAVTPEGSFTYTGLIITRRDSRITKDINTWKGKKLALVHRATTAGYIYPKWLLKKKGIQDMETFFSRIIFAGSHDTAILEVFKGRADIGATKNLIFNKVINENPALKNDIIILYESIKVPSNTLCLRGDIYSGLSKKMKNILLKMDNDPSGVDALKKLGAINFISTSDADYAPVYRMAEDLNINIKTYPFEK